MGKKYDAYVKAVQAENMAKLRSEIVNGGATQQAIQEAETNKIQAQMIREDAWNEVMKDPNG